VIGGAVLGNALFRLVKWIVAWRQRATVGAA